VKEFHRKHPAPVIDPDLADIPKKLNPFNYQKGAWVLHMLRRLLGDEPFFRGVRTYYRRHAGGNAVTEDVQRVMEAEAGTSLATFFRQWIYQPGFPEYRVTWRWDARNRQAEVAFEQAQAGGLFDTPVELAFAVGDAQERRTVRVAERRQTVRLDLPGRPSSLVLDPDGWLLHAATVSGP
jgi:aminopeptidase N